MVVSGRSDIAKKPHATRKLYGSMFYRIGVVADQIYVAEIGIFDLTVSVTSTQSMTFIYEHDLYSLEIYRICKYKLPTLRIS